jgi:hypothetical protein
MKSDKYKNQFDKRRKDNKTLSQKNKRGGNKTLSQKNKKGWKKNFDRTQ